METRTAKDYTMLDPTDEPKIKLEDCTDNPLSYTKTETYEFEVDPFVEVGKTIEFTC